MFHLFRLLSLFNLTLVFSNLYRTTVCVAILIAISVFVTNIEKQDAPALDVVWQTTQQDTAASDTVLPQAGLPTLKSPPHAIQWSSKTKQTAH